MTEGEHDAETRALPPANTEADVERLRELLERGWYRPGQSYPVLSADADAWIKEVTQVGLAAISALSLTRPAGGEEEPDPAYDYAVSLLRALHGKHFPEQAALKMLPDTLGVLTQIDNLTSALTKPPALPREGEEASLVSRFSAVLLAKLEASERKYGWQHGWMKDDWQADLSAELHRHIGKGDPIDVAAYCAFAWHHGWSLSSLPVRSGEVERLREALEPFAEQAEDDDGQLFADDAIIGDRGAGQVLTFADLRRARAALATPQQVKEGDRRASIASHALLLMEASANVAVSKPC